MASAAASVCTGLSLLLNHSFKLILRAQQSRCALCRRSGPGSANCPAGACMPITPDAFLPRAAGKMTRPDADTVTALSSRPDAIFKVLITPTPVMSHFLAKSDREPGAAQSTSHKGGSEQRPLWSDGVLQSLPPPGRLEEQKGFWVKVNEANVIPRSFSVSSSMFSCISLPVASLSFSLRVAVESWLY
ncbi:unnamed protein product [Pleuronectes platessa]|uniref:Uncharacterized protein n=1 Tax=Pleuronectes platessa TaxID=8262 RepID=A0A9N7Z199_PLEPL|nr:unnamed protein product [Pleuronectes platessa]